MAWSSPRTWTVAEVVTASIMNLHVRDNLSYLKASPVFDGTPVVGASGSPQSLTVWGNADGTTNGPLFVKNTSAGTIGTAVALNASGAAGGRSWSLVSLASGATPAGGFGVFDNTASAFRYVIDSTGLVGIGTTAPAGRLHVVGGGVATAGMVIGSAAAVTSIQTIFAAGTVARMAAFWVLDRNNTGGALLTQAALGALLGGSTNYVNNDTITIAVTAGGAVTVQRTTGTNGTHDIVILMLFQ